MVMSFMAQPISQIFRLLAASYHSWISHIWTALLANLTEGHHYWRNTYLTAAFNVGVESGTCTSLCALSLGLWEPEAKIECV